MNIKLKTNNLLKKIKNKQITKEDKKNIEEIVLLCNKKYFENGHSEINDCDFEILLNQCSKQFKNKISNSKYHPKETKVKHLYEIKEIKKTTLEKFIKTSFYKNTLLKERKIFCEEKIDGIFVSLEYNDGHLNKVLTRGDGILGMNILNNVDVNKQTVFPVTIQQNNISVIHGELITTNEIAITHKSPRSYVFSQVMLKNPNYCNFNKMILKAHSFYDKNGEHIYNLKKLKNFNLVNFKEINCLHLMQQYYDEINSSKLFSCDGIVLKSEEIKDIIAIKFEKEVFTTYLNNIQFSIGESGLISILGNLEPVIIENIKVTKIQLTKAQYESIFQGKDKVYALVEIKIKLASGVFPTIVAIKTLFCSKELTTNNFTHSKQLDNNSNNHTTLTWTKHNIKYFYKTILCPSCNSELKNYYCKNYLNCIDQHILKIIKILKAMNVIGVSKKTILDFINYNNNILNSDIAILSLTNTDFIKKHKNLNNNFVKNKTIQGMFNVILNYKTNNIHNIIYMLGIENFSKSKIKKTLSNLTLKQCLENKIIQNWIQNNEVNIKILNNLLKFYYD